MGKHLVTAADDTEQILTTEETRGRDEYFAARYLSYSVHKLRKMRAKGIGPNYFKDGLHVRYRLCDLRAYQESLMVRSLATAGR